MRFGWVLVFVCGCTALFDLQKVPSVDRDNDNVENSDDNCPDVANPDQSDFDHDLIGDVCDECEAPGGADVDGDTIDDACDGCIGNNIDADADGIDDGCDACLNTYQDVDQDGIDDGCDFCVAFSGQDVDHDQIDDACDPCTRTTNKDVDADGIDDGCDLCITSNHADVDNDQIEDVCDPCVGCLPCAVGPEHDEDGDHVVDGCDNCKVAPNPDQLNGNSDEVGDACEIVGAMGKQIENTDTFLTQDPAWWVLGSGWTVGGDVAQFTSQNSSPSFRMKEVVVFPFQVETKAVVNDLTGGTLSVYASNTPAAPTATNRFSCTIDEKGFVTVEGAGAVGISTFLLPLPATVRLRLRVAYRVGGPAAIVDTTCEATSSTDTVSITIGTTQVPPGPWYPGIGVVNGAVVFSYYNLITIKQ